MNKLYTFVVTDIPNKNVTFETPVDLRAGDVFRTEGYRFRVKEIEYQPLGSGKAGQGECEVI